MEIFGKKDAMVLATPQVKDSGGKIGSEWECMDVASNNEIMQQLKEYDQSKAAYRKQEVHLVFYITTH